MILFRRHDVEKHKFSIKTGDLRSNWNNSKHKFFNLVQIGKYIIANLQSWKHWQSKCSFSFNHFATFSQQPNVSPTMNLQRRDEHYSPRKIRFQLKMIAFKSDGWFDRRSELRRLENCEAPFANLRGVGVTAQNNERNISREHRYKLGWNNLLPRHILDYW